MLYTEKINDDGTVSRHYLKDPEIEAWLESWQKAGIPNSYKEYLRKNIRSYYYSEGIFSQWLLRNQQDGPDPSLSNLPGEIQAQRRRPLL